MPFTGSPQISVQVSLQQKSIWEDLKQENLFQQNTSARAETIFVQVRQNLASTLLKISSVKLSVLTKYLLGSLKTSSATYCFPMNNPTLNYSFRVNASQWLLPPSENFCALMLKEGTGKWQLIYLILRYKLMKIIEKQYKILEYVGILWGEREHFLSSWMYYRRIKKTCNCYA